MSTYKITCPACHWSFDNLDSETYQRVLYDSIGSRCPKCKNALTVKDVSVTAPSKKEFSNIKNYIIALVAVVVMIISAIIFIPAFNVNEPELEYVKPKHEPPKPPKPPTPTVYEYQQSVRNIWNQALSEQDSEFRKMVEDAHKTVDITRAYVYSIKAETKDGSTDAGENYSNISDVKLHIKMHWDGIMHKDGYTKLFLHHDRFWNIIDVRIVETDALINTDDPKFWFNACKELGQIVINISQVCLELGE